MLTPRRVLVIDDDDGVRDVLAMALSIGGYEVRTAMDGAIALNVLGEWRPDVILLDLMMPVMNGWVFRRNQLASSTLAQIPVIILSAVQDARREAEELLAAAVLPKPFVVTEIVALVQRLAGPPPTA